MVRNALNVTASKFGLTFKILLYDFIAMVIFFAITTSILLPYFNEVSLEIAELQIVEKFVDMLRALIGNGIAEEITAASDVFYASLREAIVLLQTNFLSRAYLITFAMGIVLKFVINLRTVPIADIVNKYMCENSDYNFFSNYIHNFGASVKYALLYTLFSLPFDIALFLLGYYLTGILLAWLGVAALFFIVIIIILLVSFRQMLFFGWIPYIVAGKERVWTAFFKGLKLSASDFWGIFGMLIGISITIWVITTIVAITSFGIGLLLLLPLILIFWRANELVKYYNVKKLRFYSSPNTVHEPQIVEIELEVPSNGGEQDKTI